MVRYLKTQLSSRIHDEQSVVHAVRDLQYYSVVFNLVISRVFSLSDLLRSDVCCGFHSIV